MIRANSAAFTPSHHVPNIVTSSRSLRFHRYKPPAPAGRPDQTISSSITGFVARNRLVNLAFVAMRVLSLCNAVSFVPPSAHMLGRSASHADQGRTARRFMFVRLATVT
jgi:hypothetical protein